MDLITKINSTMVNLNKILLTYYNAISLFLTTTKLKYPEVTKVPLKNGLKMKHDKIVS